MTTTSPPDTSHDHTTLITTAHNLGLRVWWTDQQHAYYSQRHQSIWLPRNLTNAETRSLLAHEIAHAIHGDRGPQPPHIEARAWRTAARLLISETEYRAAELLHGPNVGSLAEALDVTREVIHAYQDTLRTTTCAAPSSPS
ncbi:ImmA/IrrE family metallo-endopeptidase [Dermabacter hominis]|uniref:ImmA/IrrE family metallo-endopeptidase n=1 Tax=Dermabacter hominis TaxID=36740 RepID=UPI003B8A9180